MYCYALPTFPVYDMCIQVRKYYYFLMDRNRVAGLGGGGGEPGGFSY
jgi:hypothetical protein